ncbi:NAD(P)H-dependent oxidoreductase [Spirillospora sp. NPDC029432]|uniref:NADPH-dependent FMN reductase n=1 Tax=Spirillospora sp. NPDC029432 TaxID=3154599 RepID=UPI0034559CCC
MNDRLHVAIIIGSNRNGRFGLTVADWFVEQVERHEGVRPDVIDLGGVAVAADLGPDGDAEATAKLERADAFVIITPEYNHSFPGTLKNFIDAHFTQWQAKPVAFVSYGGMAGGQRAVEHLRPVFAELHAVTVRDTVSFHNPWGQFDADGRHQAPDAANTAAKTMLDQLAWWAHALRDARAARPYSA